MPADDLARLSQAGRAMQHGTLALSGLSVLTVLAEAQEPLSLLTAACLVAVGVGVHIGCSRGLLDAYCPPGTQKVIHDTWDRTQSLTIDCNLLHDVACGVGAVTAVELMREACGAVP